MEKLIILGHINPDVDSIISGYLLEKVLNKKGFASEFIIPDKQISEDTLNICINNGLDPTKYMKDIDLNNKNTKYILVDHNYRKLAGEIVCIIDHHPTTKKIKIDYYFNSNVSSIAYYIAKHNEELLDLSDLKLAIVASMVDTASFHSTKGDKQDIDWILSICDKYNFNYDELYEQGLCLTPLENLNKASLNGFKSYDFDGRIVESSYIQLENPSLKEKEVEEILNILKSRVKQKQLTAFAFIVHDMTEFKTMYYLISKDKIQRYYYTNYTARGNTIIPEIEKMLNELI